LKAAVEIDDDRYSSEPYVVHYRYLNQIFNSKLTKKEDNENVYRA